MLLAALAGTLVLAQAPASPPERAPKPPDCQTLIMTSPGPGITQLCQGEAEMRRADAAAGDASERRKHLASAASEIQRAADALRDLELKIYAIEALARLYDDTHLNEPNEVEQALRSLIPLMPGNSSPLRRIATIQEAQGQIDAAENTLLSARQQVPDDVEVYRALSQFFARRATQMSTDAVRAERPDEPVPQPGAPDAEGYYSVGGEIPPPRRASPRVPAQRSQDADAAGVTGVVLLEIRVDESGAVSDAKILRSIPMLDDAALATVRQWRYEPTLIDGRAVPVRMTVTVNFAAPK